MYVRVCTTIRLSVVYHLPVYVFSITPIIIIDLLSICHPSNFPLDSFGFLKLLLPSNFNVMSECESFLSIPLGTWEALKSEMSSLNFGEASVAVSSSIFPSSIFLSFSISCCLERRICCYPLCVSALPHGPALPYCIPGWFLHLSFSPLLHSRFDLLHPNPHHRVLCLSYYMFSRPLYCHMVSRSCFITWLPSL